MVPPIKPGLPISSCLRCGTCCKKGGPSFHQTDKTLIADGVIPSKYLYTIRAGELAYDNVQGGLRPVPSDIIKIKAQNRTWTCLFFDEGENTCRIYPHRPVECRALKCWDTREIEGMYAKNRLTRQDLLSNVEGLWNLISNHQARCDCGRIRDLADALGGEDGGRAQQELREIIQYDMQIRELVVSQAKLDPGILDFLLGRPLIRTIDNYGLQVQRQGKKIRLTKAR
ncbi:MAG: YkgJ family cysteine cluster protein [Desulfobacterales bacterium]|nr:MAG: YkgJ family cysteine cluster protein [Desulfobacterales bacterium]